MKYLYVYYTLFQVPDLLSGYDFLGDFLIQTASDTPLSVPRVHAAKNVGQGIYNEILYESKSGCEFHDPDKDKS